MKKLLFILFIVMIFSLNVFSQSISDLLSTSIQEQNNSNSFLNGSKKESTVSNNSSANANLLLQNVSDAEKYSAQFDFVGNVQMAMANPNYMVTSGDVYNLSFAVGTSPVTYTIPVDSSYKIRVVNLGVIDASGKTYLELKKQVEDIVIKNYPMSGVQFVLLSPAIFKVVIKGEVDKTLERQAWALTRLSSVLTNSLTEFSSVRKVTITSSNGKTKDYDLFKAIRFGDMKENPYLRPGDVVTINRADKKVVLDGSIERPGEYELLPNENLKDLIEVYGNGFLLQADKNRIELLRIDDNKLGKRFYLSQTDYENNYALENKDSVFVSSTSDFEPVFFVEGAVEDLDKDIDTDSEGTSLDTSNKLSFRFEFGKKYSYFVREYRDIFNNNSDLNNAYIIRNSEIIPVDLYKMLYDASYLSDLTIEPYDTLRIPFKQFFVSVAGSVNNPGRYPYIPDRTYEYYVGLAGGFVKNQNSGDSVTILDINGDKLKKTDFITPECTITAKTNSFTYYFGIYAPVITTILSAISTTLSIIAVTSK